MLVVDASIVAAALADDADGGDRARQRLRDEHLAAPELLDLEVASVVRGRLLGGHLDERRATFALTDLDALPVQRVPHRSLISRCWQLRDNLTMYDAAYVALAEMLDITLLTADRRLAKTPGPQCPIELLT